MAKTELRFNMDGLKHIERQAAGYRTRVGIIGTEAEQIHTIVENSSKTGRKFDVRNFRYAAQSLTNAQIGLIQIFGSFTKKIPPRDFLLMPLEVNRTQIMQTVQKSQKMKAAINRGDILGMLKLLGLICEGFVQQAFETRGFGQWPANRPSTIAQKGSAQPLINTAQLRRVVASDVKRKGEA